MKTVITLSEIDQTDFSSASEIWLAPPDSLLNVEDTGDELCLWRGQPVVSHDMLSEGTHGQNVRRIWLITPNINDQQQILKLERQVKARLDSEGMVGEFYPAQNGVG